MAQYVPFPSFVRGAAIKYFRKKYRKAEIRSRWTKTLELYKGFVEKAPDIGGKENNISTNLYLALAVFAFYEAAGREISLEELNTLVTEYMPKSIPIVSSFFDFNKPENQKKLRVRYEKYKVLSDEKLNNGEWGNSWRVELNPHARAKGVAFDLVGCPLADFAKTHGYLHLMPVLCGFDYLTASLMHAKLIRSHTVAEGFENCDYWYIGDKESEG